MKWRVKVDGQEPYIVSGYRDPIEVLRLAVHGPRLAHLPVRGDIEIENGTLEASVWETGRQYLITPWPKPKRKAT